MNNAKNILVVDDNSNNIEVLHEMLEGNYRLVDAACGSDALELAERLLPRFVLLDVMLPDLDGYEVCRRMRRIPGMQSSRIIIVSAKAMPSERRAGYAAGASAYVTKPFDDGEILAAMKGYEESDEGRDF